MIWGIILMFNLSMEGNEKIVVTSDKVHIMKYLNFDKITFLRLISLLL